MPKNRLDKIFEKMQQDFLTRTAWIRKRLLELSGEEEKENVKTYQRL